MPIYEYKCVKCGHSLEALQKMSDAPLRKCPACGKAALAKLVSAASFRLKGGGWYETDFKTGDKKQLANSDSADSYGGDKERADKERGDKEKDGAVSTAKTETADKSKDSGKGDTAKAESKASDTKRDKTVKAGKSAANKSTSKPA